METVARERIRAGTNWEQKAYLPVRKNNEASETTGWAWALIQDKVQDKDDSVAALTSRF